MTDAAEYRLRPRRFKSGRSIVALILREMITTYGRSPGGYLWAIVEPVAAIALLTAAFQFILRSPPIGSNFPLYFATGYMPFTLAMGIERKVNASIRFSKSLLFYPGVRWIDAVVARLLLAVITNLTTGILVIGGVHVVFGLTSIMDFSAISASIAMAIAVGFGLGLVNCTLSHLFPLWTTAWTVLTRPLVLASGVVFFIDKLPSWSRDILWWNPLAHVVAEMRRGFYATYSGDWVSPVYVWTVAALLIAFGLLLLRRHHKSMISG